jgi:hypothetical protein
MRKRIKASLTIEAAILVPLILFLCAGLLQFLCYHHDRTILTAAAHETVAYACGRQGMDEEELEAHLKKRTKGALMLLQQVEQTVEIQGEQVTVTCQTKKKPWTLKIQCVSRKTQPEVWIRNARKLEELK